MRKCGKMW
jgi:hypothetical protein